MRWNAGSGTRSTGGGIGRSDVGIRAVIDVEKSSLGAFEKDFLSALQGVMQINDGVRHKGTQFRAGGEITLVHFLVIGGFGAKRAENGVVLSNLSLQFFREQSGLHQVGDSQSGTGSLVAVGGTDSALGGTDF